MKKEWMPREQRVPPSRVPEEKEHVEPQTVGASAGQTSLASLHRHIGNQAVQRLLAQRSSQGAFELDEETADRIDQARGGGQPLDSSVQAQMGETMGHDFSGVRVHTLPEADTLNRQLGAKAFTTGQDVFFREGAYNPHSSSGQELIAHELTHVVQQGAGAVGGGERMTVNAPGDAYEQEANSVAETATGAGVGAQAQRQEEEEEEEVMQMQVEEEEEEEPVQMQPIEEEEEELMP